MESGVLQRSAGQEFDGKWYALLSQHYTKTAAKEQAEKFRRGGVKGIRIVKQKYGMHLYLVYGRT